MPIDHLSRLARSAVSLALAPLRLVTGRAAMRSAGPLDGLRAGDGRIVDLDGRRLAAFRDSEGVIHAVSPICTHLRCVVAFDGAAEEWVCPCHGSRFALDGALLRGPARTPLERIEVV